MRIKATLKRKAVKIPRMFQELAPVLIRSLIDKNNTSLTFAVST